MKTRIALWIVGVLLWSGAASANKPVLSEDTPLIGRFNATELAPILRLTVDTNGDMPLSTHVIARFQNNRPLQRTESGDWVNWDETHGSLLDTQFRPNEDGTLTFNLVAQDLSHHFLPIVFTVAYQTEHGLKSGYVVIDQ